MIKKSLGALLLLTASLTHAATMEQARAALSKRDFAAAMPILLELGNEGNADAQYQLGIIYGRGNAAAPENHVTAAQWYLKAAEQGHEGAMAHMGLNYAYACGVERNDAESAKWFRRDADKGAAGSMFHLGRLYLAGRGVPKDVAEATRLFKQSGDLGYARGQYFYGLLTRPGEGLKKAEIAEAEMNQWLDGYVNNDFPRALAVVRPVAARGDAWAQAFLGLMLQKGEGTTRNEAEGLKWTTLAAEQGYSLSQSDLAARYANGTGVPQSQVQAYKWASLAAAQNDDAAKKLLAELNAKMDAAQLQEAQKLLAAAQPRH